MHQTMNNAPVSIKERNDPIKEAAIAVLVLAECPPGNEICKLDKARRSGVNEKWDFG